MCPASYVDCGRCSCVAESTCQFCSDEATTTAPTATTTAPAPVTTTTVATTVAVPWCWRWGDQVTKNPWEMLEMEDDLEKKLGKKAKNWEFY